MKREAIISFRYPKPGEVVEASIRYPFWRNFPPVRLALWLLSPVPFLALRVVGDVVAGVLAIVGTAIFSKNVDALASWYFALAGVTLLAEWRARRLRK